MSRGEVLTPEVAEAGRLATLVHPGPITCLAFAPDGRMLAAGTRRVASRRQVGLVRLWDHAAGRERGTLDGHARWAWSLAFSPDGTTLAVGGHKEVRLWDLAACRLRATLSGYTGVAWSLAFGPDGGTLFTTGTRARSRQLFRWDLATGQCQASPRGHTGPASLVAVSPDGRVLATAGGSTVKLWDLATDEEVATLQAHPEGQGAAWGIQSLAYDLGGGEESPLAIENGTAPIVVVSKLVGEHKDLKGNIVVTGKLRLGKKGLLLLEAEKVEAAPKK